MTLTLNSGLGADFPSPLIALDSSCRDHFTFNRKASSTIRSIFSVYLYQCCWTFRAKNYCLYKNIDTLTLKSMLCLSNTCIMDYQYMYYGFYQIFQSKFSSINDCISTLITLTCSVVIIKAVKMDKLHLK